MTDQQSFTRIEHELLPEFRDHMSHAESDQDVRKFFVRTVQELLRRATDGAVDPHYEDIELHPGASPQWALNGPLANDARLERLLADSDLDDILERFARTAAHHVRHERRHPDRPDVGFR